MNIEDKLPKAEDVLREHHVSDSLFSILNRDGFTPASQGDRIIKAIHEYGRRLLDVAVQECDNRIIPGHSVQAPSMIAAGKAILKLKEMLK